jgi:hypothetical protein
MSTLILLTGCKTSKNTNEVNVSASARSYKNLITEIEKTQSNYKSFESTVFITAKVDKSKFRATGHIKHVRDEGIFVSIKKFGFELGRVWITPDSFFMLNRIEREFMAEPIQYIQEEYDIYPEFGLIQELLNGQPSFGKYDKKKKSLPMDGEYLLATSSAYKNIKLSVWMNTTDLNIKKAFYEDEMERGIQIEYGTELEGNMHLKRNIQTENIEDSEARFELRYKDPQFNDTRIPPISIPSHYSRRT